MPTTNDSIHNIKQEHQMTAAPLDDLRATRLCARGFFNF